MASSNTRIGVGKSGRQGTRRGPRETTRKDGDKNKAAARAAVEFADWPRGTTAIYEVYLTDPCDPDHPRTETVHAPDPDTAWLIAENMAPGARILGVERLNGRGCGVEGDCGTYPGARFIRGRFLPAPSGGLAPVDLSHIKGHGK